MRTVTASPTTDFRAVQFPERLVALIKKKDLTQQALSQFTPEKKHVVKAVMEGLILKHDAQRFARAEESR